MNFGDVITVKARITISVTSNPILYENGSYRGSLYDDGAHGDSLPNDGIWGNSLTLISIGSNIGYQILIDGVWYNNLRSIKVVIQASCVDLINNGSSADKLDIVFMGDDYTAADLATYAADVTSFSNKLLSIPPFDSQSGKINIHRIDNTIDLRCAYNCFGIPRLICCGQTYVNGAASACPYDEIIVLVNNSTYGGGGVLGGHTSISYKVDPMVAVHEFGHGFGSLRDEYVGYTTSGLVGGNGDDPNCDDTAGCAKWISTPGTVCLSGCTYPNWYRSINNGIMRTLQNNTDFGEVNINVLTNKLNYYQ